MIHRIQKNWIQEFGLHNRKPPYFISSPDQLNNPEIKIPQPLALRRAFTQLNIDGVLCLDQNPVIYFREMENIDTTQIIELHRLFWNQGITPLLVVIATDEVHIYSGLVPPQDAAAQKEEKNSGLVEKLDRVEEQLQSFLLSVESGEYFHIHQRSFDPYSRVDRKLLRNLKETRLELAKIQTARLQPQVLDALLCRLVFTCYLFDRGVIGQKYLEELGIIGATHLRDILSIKARTEAKKNLYLLFGKLCNDFNGDLFTDDLKAESTLISSKHLDILDDFFHATDIKTGQITFWPYDFSFIPIETISAIYEHFLKASGEEQKKEAGAFYTPRFLAEFVLDTVLERERSLLDKKYLDPACGSGIFLVGLFNRLAQEWQFKNPGARYDKRAKGLMGILCTNLYGVDINPSACRITAFSLYLAFLDQLSPPDIQNLLGKWNRLPNLVYSPDAASDIKHRTIYNIDFFSDTDVLPVDVHIIVGNPPWGPVMKSVEPTSAEIWCKEKKLEHPNREKSVPFIWKAPAHLGKNGKVCFILPHGILFNHNDTAIRFQRSLFLTHTVDRVVNLTDYQFFLFEESQAPALIIRYSEEKPADNTHKIDYWAPKTDWAILQSEIMSVYPIDRSKIKIREVIDDLNGTDGPQIWKQKFWATERDLQLLERLSLYSRLSDHTSQLKEKKSKKPWVIAQGFQPLGPGDKEIDQKTITLSSTYYVDADKIKPFLMPSDCDKLTSALIKVRRSRSDISLTIFDAPHVLVTRGFSKATFADFGVAFRSSVRGIHGPLKDRNLLIFFSFYLKSALAKYFLFHTSSNWGVTRSEVHDQELLRLPFPFPDDCPNPKMAWELVQESAYIYDQAYKKLNDIFSDHETITQDAQFAAEKLINLYFDLNDVEQILIADTINFNIPSFRPSRSKTDIPSLKQSTDKFFKSYAQILCNRLNSWAKEKFQIHCKVVSGTTMGIGVAILEKTARDEQPVNLPSIDGEILQTLNKIQKTTTTNYGTFDIVRGLKVFDKNLLYITKPIGQRFWTNTAALNDADEIAASILTKSLRSGHDVR